MFLSVHLDDMTDRTSLIQIRVSAAEKRRLEAAAKQAGLPVSTWLRMLALAAARNLNGKIQ
jgi:antitoxin component of RelBE/YafQ-DinJ toxin-antitoxin module